MDKAFSPSNTSKALEIPRSTTYRWILDRKKDPDRCFSPRGRRPPGFCYTLSGDTVPDEYIVEMIQSYRDDEFFQNEGGYRKLSQYLRRDHGIVINHKKVYRLCKGKGFLLKRRRKSKIHQVGQPARNHQVCRPNQVWEFDIKYCWIHGEKRFAYLTVFIDVYTRQIKSWGLSPRCTSEDVFRVLKAAPLALGKKLSQDHELYIRSDNGTQMKARAWLQKIQNMPLQHEYIPPRCPNKNAHIESFFAILSRHMEDKYFLDYRGLYSWLVRFMHFYEFERIHGSLGTTPNEFITQFASENRSEWVQRI